MEATIARKGPNVSVLHLRSTSEPWETSPPTFYAEKVPSKTYMSNRSTNPHLTKHQSLGGNENQSYKWNNSSSSFNSGSDLNAEIFVPTSCNRELSPVRWCDREVDGVYLGKSGWVQVQQRSLDESKHTTYPKSFGTSLDENKHTSYGKTSVSSSLQASKRTGVKLANYHFNSEPGTFLSSVKSNESQRPAHLSIQTRNFEKKIILPPSPRYISDSNSPPCITPIISPPPAFQDRNKNSEKTRTFFGGKTPFLPRSTTIIDSDGSPPQSPIFSKWKTETKPPINTKIKSPPKVEPKRVVPVTVSSKVSQTKSFEDASLVRRTHFLQRHGESSSSSSSSMGFRSLDSCVSRPVMPRLSENTDSSMSVYEDADEEDNNSSSIAMSISSNTPLVLPLDLSKIREKISPTGRLAKQQFRAPIRKSPAGSDKIASSSSSESNEIPTRPSSGSSQQSKRSSSSRHSQNRTPTEDPSVQKVRRSRSLQLPERKAGKDVQTRVSPQREAYIDQNKKRNNSKNGKSLEDSLIDDEMRKEAEVVTGFLYGNRTRAAAQALLIQRSKNKSEEQSTASKKPNNSELTVYYVGNGKKEKTKVLHRGITSPNLPSDQYYPGTFVEDNYCNAKNCDFWPHCAHRESLSRESQYTMRSSQSYPTHQKSLDSNLEPRYARIDNRPPQDQSSNYKCSHYDKTVVPKRPQYAEPIYSTISDIVPPVPERRVSPNRSSSLMNRSIGEQEKKLSPVRPVLVRNTTLDNINGWSREGRRIGIKVGGTKGADWPAVSPDDIPLYVTDAQIRETILTRPGSAPSHDEKSAKFVESSQRSMSLPKSFLSVNYNQSGRGLGTESLNSSPGTRRKCHSPDTSQTAPVTPQHEGTNHSNYHYHPHHHHLRRSSPVNGGGGGGGVGSRGRTKATSTPQLVAETKEEGEEDQGARNNEQSDKTQSSRHNFSDSKDLENRRTTNVASAESVLQKFRKTFSLRFQRKDSSKESSLEVIDSLPEIIGEPDHSEGENVKEPSPSTSTGQISEKEPGSESKSRFGPLIWRGSKERKKINKAARNAKCNSGDSGIQIEMVTGGCGIGGGGGDSSESHDTDDVQNDDLDSPPSIRRRPGHSKSSRPHSDLINQILIDKFKADLRQRAHKHNQVRRTRSDLGGQRLLHWDPRSSYRRMISSPPPLRGRPRSPQKKPPDAPGGVQLRHRGGVRFHGAPLRRSLSQPLDIDKLSPLMRTKRAGLRAGGTVLSEDEHDNKVGISDDEMMSDSESSIASLNERKKSLELAMDEEMIILAEAVFDHVAIEMEELAFRAGDVIEVIETANRDWWWGSCAGKSGWFPAQFVRLRVSQEDTVEDCLAAMASGRPMSAQIRRRTSISLLSNDQVRTSVVRELVHTERDFVKVLQDVAEGYIAECRKRKDMFSDDQIRTIFMNLEEILNFQTSFLKDLETRVEWDTPYKSCVGRCFLNHKQGFKMYSDYCNSHPLSTVLLQELYQFNNYSKFFEACRLMRGLIEIPLDGYLLTPVQRICKYPLQLAELLKYTKADHPDYNDIKDALEVMRDVAILINERKRRMESLEKLAAWQQRVEGWEGEDLIELSSQLIYQGEVARVTNGIWTNNITLFLFDHQVVYCKKDILKRNTHIYKGRICLDITEVIDVPDGKDTHVGVSVRHAIKLHSCVSDKWLLFCCRSSGDKQRWLKAFSEERKLVAQDKNEGLQFPSAAKQLARVSAKCQRRPPRKPRGSKSNFKHDSAYMGSNLQLNANVHNSNSLGRKVGTWFMFGTNKKQRHRQLDVS